MHTVYMHEWIPSRAARWIRKVKDFSFTKENQVPHELPQHQDLLELELDLDLSTFVAEHAQGLQSSAPHDESSSGEGYCSDLLRFRLHCLAVSVKSHTFVCSRTARHV